MRCEFCSIVAGEAPGEIVYQDEAITAFRDKRPQAPTHILIVPNEHIPNVASVCAEHARLIWKAVCVANDLAQVEGIAPRGYRLVINCGPDAGQSIDHLHFHLLGGRPMRWPPG